MEKKKGLIIGVIVLAVLVAAFIVVYNMTKPGSGNSGNQQVATGTSADSAEGTSGLKNITIEVKGSDGNTVSYAVSTEAEFLRQAMDEAEGLTYSGTESDFGMMVEVVNGEQAIYAVDNAYWAFYVNGEYGQYGIDSQPVTDGDTYSIVYEPAEVIPEETADTTGEVDAEDEGSKHIIIEVTSADGTSVTYEVATDAEFLRQAMDEAEGLTYSGTESDFGMMVEVVNGEQAIYAVDNAYWAFYVNGEYGQYGIDSQPVEDGDTYSIVYEAA
ncbi:MAG: DUF4430 domain-containing protein [Lachnospiraceae bacterium]|nr:DUF4430 domain-containing protein [Lachnospiraceae bacterium]